MRRAVVAAAAAAALAGCGGGPPGDSLGDKAQVFVLDVRHGDLRQITDDGDDYAPPAWSPSGDRIAGSFGSGIVLLSPDGRRLKGFHVANVNAETPPAWSRDGRRLAFETTYDNRRTGSTDARLTLLLVATGARRAPGNFAVDTPSWSPHDRSLVYLTGDLVIDTKPIRQQIWSVRPAGGKPRRIARGATDDFPPQLSRDGRRLLFARPNSIWTARADGSRQTRLAKGLSLPAAAWAPNDRDVAAVTSGEARSHAFLLSPAGKRRALLPRMIASEPVAWAPGGRLIAWADEHSGATLIHVVRPDGSGHRVVAHMADRVVIVGLTWSPDSRRLAFSAYKSNED